MGTIKKLSFCLLLALFVTGTGAVVGHRKMFGYLLEQAQGQWHLIRRARSITNVLREDLLPAALQKRLRDVEKIKAFSEQKLHLTAENTYEHLYVDNPPITMWVVSACEPYTFREKIWHFPVMGSFPYKGFFNKRSALKEVAALKEAGYDTRLTTASGWSTLGWLPNPLTLKMLQRPVGLLAELIIHELTHNNLHVKNNTLLNENVASFIGHKGAVAFLAEHYGHNSPEMDAYVSYRQDAQQYFAHMLQGMRRLDTLYRTLPERALVANKKAMKDALIACIVEELAHLPFRNDAWRQRHSHKLPNNAFFMSCRNYHSDQKKLEADFAKSGQALGAYIQQMKNSVGRGVGCPSCPL